MDWELGVLLLILALTLILAGVDFFLLALVAEAGYYAWRHWFGKGDVENGKDAER